tara:strand:+ start:1324 stop:3024 length:1701 start_codon:yes stop_codon:yes gene_type:complete
MFKLDLKKTIAAGLFAGLSMASFAQTARVQIIHNSADDAAEEVDVYLNGDLLVDDFAFRTATAFIDAPAGEEIEIDIAPSTSVSVDESIANFPLTLMDGSTYVVVADGITGLSPTDYSPAPAFGLEIYDMGREEATMATNTDVLVHHGSTDAPTVDVFESYVPAGTIVDDAPYTAFAGYLELGTADYTLEIQNATGSVVVASYEAPLASLELEGAALTVVASGFLDPSVNGDGPAFGLWVALPEGGDLIELPKSISRLQVIHNSADDIAEEVDIYLNGALLLDDFAYRTATPFIDAPAGVDIEIAVAPGTSMDVDDAIAIFPLTLASRSKYIVVADGITGLSATDYTPAPAFGLEIYDMAREEASTSGNTDVLVHHGSTDAPTVDVFETSVPAGTLVDNAAYPQFAGYLELVTADYLLEVRNEAGDVTVAGYAAPLSTLALDDAAITVVASGFLDPSANGDGPAFGLWVALASGGDLIPLPTAFVGVNELTELEFNIFPNPTTEFITINVENNETINEIIITDINGRIVQTSSFSKQISVSELEEGMYFLNINTAEGISTRSFIKH